MHTCKFIEKVSENNSDLDFVGTNFTTEIVDNLNVKESNFSACYFSNMLFKDTIFQNCGGKDNTYRYSTFFKTKFLNCRLREDTFESCILIDCTFENCFLFEMSFHNTVIESMHIKESEVSSFGLFHSLLNNLEVENTSIERPCHYMPLATLDADTQKQLRPLGLTL